MALTLTLALALTLTLILTLTLTLIRTFTLTLTPTLTRCAPSSAEAAAEQRLSTLSDLRGVP